MSKTLRTTIVPTNEPPNFFSGYPFRVTSAGTANASSQRPSSAGTSRSRGSHSRSGSAINMYVGGTTQAINPSPYVQTPTQTSRPQSAGQSRPSQAAASSAHIHIPAVPQIPSGNNSPPVPSSSGSNSQLNTQNLPAFPNNTYAANMNQNSASGLGTFYSSRPKSANAVRRTETTPAVINIGGVPQGHLPSNPNLPLQGSTSGKSNGVTLPVAGGVAAVNDNSQGVDPWKSAYKLHYGYHNATSTNNTNISNNINGTNSSSNSNSQANILGASKDRSAPTAGQSQPVQLQAQIPSMQTGQYPQQQQPQPQPQGQHSRPSSATNRIRQAINESQKYTPNGVPNAPGTLGGTDGRARTNDTSNAYQAVAGEYEEDDDDVDMGLDADVALDENGERKVLTRDGDSDGIRNPHLIVGKKKHEGHQDEDDDEEMDGRPVQGSRSHPEVSTITGTGNSQSMEMLGGSVDIRNSSIDSYVDDNIDIGLSTVPNQFCTKRDAVELKKLVLMTSHSRGGIVPSSSAVMDMYMVGKVIGVGSYGKVRAAWHRLTSAKVAIKTYDKAKLKDPSHWKRVYSEIKIMEQISHPRIARMYEAVETPKRMHLIMECLDGGNLCSYVKQKKRLTEDESRKIFFQILQAIDYLHNLGVSHRDIKLENVLFTDNRDIKLIDFGFSTVCQPGKRLKVFCGTPSYMAPEIVRRTEYEGKPVDIWSLGVLLYALLCGCFPFRAKTYPDLYRRIARGTFNIPDELSAPVKDLIRQLLNIDAAQRVTASNAIRHPWLQTQLQHAPDMDKMRREIPILISDRAADDINEETLSEIERYGITKEDIVKTVLTKTHSAIGTLYYLLLDISCSKKKSQGNSASKKSSSSFTERIKSATNVTQQYATQMQVQQAQTQMPLQSAQQNAQAQQQLQYQVQYNYNPAYVLNYQQGGNVMTGPSAAAAAARPRSASATRSGGSAQRPLSAYAGRR